MAGDNLNAPTYDDLMGTAKAFIVVKLDTKNPIEIGNFVSEFTSVSSQYDKFIKEKYPDLAAEAHIFVKQVKRGSIIVELLPFLPFVVMGAEEIFSPLEQVNAINDFVKTYGGKLKSYFKKNGRVDDATRSDLKDFMGSVEAIAKDPDATASIEAVVFEDGKRKIKAAIKFDTKQAVRAVEQIEAHKKSMEHKGDVDHARMLMVFRQTNVKNPPVGKRTGEWVAIEKISDKELPLIYASDLAEQRIKHEITQADDNVYKKGFIVDVNVETKGGRPVAYRVTNLHQVIDLPDQDEL